MWKGDLTIINFLPSDKLDYPMELLHIVMNRLRQKYLDEVRNLLKDELKIANYLAVPKVEKVVINIGLGEAKDNEAILVKAKNILSALSGQLPVVTRAKKSISSFKLIQGAPIGLMVTLRGEKMYAFLDKLFNVVLPRVRDFRGLSENSFDNYGNYNLGLREQIIFPEVDYKDIDKTRGLQITITTSAKSKNEGKLLLEKLGLPLDKEH